MKLLHSQNQSMPFSTLHRSLTCAGLFMGALLALQALGSPGFQAADAKLKLQAAGAPNPASCATGFTPVSKKLVQHEGKAWYQYTCARQETIVRSCNADTEVIEVKNDIISLPSDGQSQNSKLQLSYQCFHYVPVK